MTYLNLALKYPDTKNYTEENLKGVCEGEGLAEEEVICFVDCLCLMFTCLWSFGWKDTFLCVTILF